MDILCKCGGIIIFEKKRTFIHPDQKNGVCINCHKQYVLKGDKLIEKDGGKNAC